MLKIIYFDHHFPTLTNCPGKENDFTIWQGISKVGVFNLDFKMVMVTGTFMEISILNRRKISLGS